MSQFEVVCRNSFNPLLCETCDDISSTSGHEPLHMQTWHMAWLAEEEESTGDLAGWYGLYDVCTAC